MALINTAGILAGRRGFRVLVLDLDLEAPGLSYLDPELPDVSPAEAQRQLSLQAGFVDLMRHPDANELDTLATDIPPHTRVSDLSVAWPGLGTERGH